MFYDKEIRIRTTERRLNEGNNHATLYRMIGISLAFIFLLSPLLAAQERGQYLPGFGGFNSGDFGVEL